MASGATKGPKARTGKNSRYEKGANIMQDAREFNERFLANVMHVWTWWCRKSGNIEKVFAWSRVARVCLGMSLTERAGDSFHDLGSKKWSVRLNALC